MSMSYHLGLTRTEPPRSILLKIQELVGGEILDTGQLLVVPELLVGASIVDDQNSKDLYLEEWEIGVNTSVGFFLSNKTDFQYAAATLMTIAAVQLVSQLDTDAGMTYQHEKKLLSRRAGVLYLNDWWPQWNEPAVREKIPQPYVMTSENPDL